MWWSQQNLLQNAYFLILELSRDGKNSQTYSQKLKLLCRVHIEFIYKNKIKLFTEKKTKLKIPTLFLFLLLLPYPPFPLPLIILPPAALHMVWYFLQNI